MGSQWGTVHGEVAVEFAAIRLGLLEITKPWLRLVHHLSLTMHLLPKFPRILNGTISESDWIMET